MCSFYLISFSWIIFTIIQWNIDAVSLCRHILFFITFPRTHRISYLLPITVKFSLYRTCSSPKKAFLRANESIISTYLNRHPRRDNQPVNTPLKTIYENIFSKFFKDDIFSFVRRANDSQIARVLLRNKSLTIVLRNLIENREQPLRA